MKAIILAAGSGNRMGSETSDKPKCMISFQGRPLIDYTIQTIRACGIDDIIIVNGYKKEILETYLGDRNIKFISNRNFNKTNMVYTLFCAEVEMDTDLIISYADIIYDISVLQQLMNNNSEFVTIVDKNWRDLWKLRMDDPLSDAESMKIDNRGNILELGQKPRDYNDIEGQYIGLTKISKSIVAKVIDYYHSLDQSGCFDGKDYDNMYMTSFIQLIADNLVPVKAQTIQGGWLEFDCQEDLVKYNRNEELKHLL